ncbi:MAG: TetR/AcrR family transcriptional regulator [Sphaerochaeta sp.]
MTKKKEEIILALLSLGEQKGLANVSLADIAEARGIKKASIYSHFGSRDEIIDAMLEYCGEILKTRSFVVNFKAKDANDLMTELVNGFLETFTEKPLSSCLSIVEQQKMVEERFSKLSGSLKSMIEARLRVAFEYCVQRGWLDIKDTDIAADILTSAVLDCLRDTVRAEKNRSPDTDIEWKIERLVSGLTTLFA